MIDGPTQFANVTGNLFQHSMAKAYLGLWGSKRGNSASDARQ